jgi:hypothetical protein
MIDFDALQDRFQTALLQDQPPSVDLLVRRSAAQFGVYRNAYRVRLRAALRDNYETLPLVMGDDAFDALANAYIEAQPSTHYSLRWFGHQLGAFMASNDGLVPHPAIRDLACMEWALRCAFDAAQGSLLSPDELSAVPAQDWAELRFMLHPAVHLLELQWAVGPVWHALKEGQEQVPAPEALAHCLLVWRDGMHTQWKSLTAVEADYLRGLQTGQTFGELCATLADTVGEQHAAQTAVALLRELLGSGVIGSMRRGASEPVSP